MKKGRVTKIEFDGRRCWLGHFAICATTRNVEYTVTKTGSIRDPFAVDCSPKGIFERASLKAALKFKYKPRVVDGEAIEVAGVQNKFTYELEGGRR